MEDRTQLSIDSHVLAYPNKLGSAGAEQRCRRRHSSCRNSLCQSERKLTTNLNFWECQKSESLGKPKDFSPTTTLKHVSRITTGGPAMLKHSRRFSSAKSFMKSVPSPCVALTMKWESVRNSLTRYLNGLASLGRTTCACRKRSR